MLSFCRSKACGLARSAAYFRCGNAMRSLSTETMLFTDSHEYFRDGGDGTATIGITDHAQDLLGDIVFVELPEIGENFDAGETFASVESVKAASDVYAPVTGTVVAVNEELDDSPEIINEAPYEKGWFVKLKVVDPSEIGKLMDYDAYSNFVEEED